MLDFIKKSFDDGALIFRYIVSGLVGGIGVNLAVFYLATETLGLWHIWSSIMSFLASLIAAFLLQKYWTFRGEGKHRAHKQLVIYTVLAVVNLLFNMAALYILVDILRLWALGSQAVILGFVAFVSFLINKNHTFKGVAEGSQSR